MPSRTRRLLTSLPLLALTPLLAAPDGCNFGGGDVPIGEDGTPGDDGGDDDTTGGTTGGSGVTGGTNATGGTASGGAATGGTATGGTVSVGGSNATGGTATGGTVSVGGSDATGGASATGGTVSTGGSNASGGTTSTGGAGGMGGTAGDGGSGGGMTTDPYAPRTGPFKMLVYSRTTGFRHGSIAAGQQMLQQIAEAQGFTTKLTETNEEITVNGLSQYEIVFFMNSTGDVFNATEQQAFETWMTTKNGAFAGVHSATDTENGWAFYSEVTGQYYSGHGQSNTPGSIVFEPSAATFPAVVGMPNPWQRNEEWYLFNNYQQWSVKPGFKILGRKQSDNQPITWVREWGNFRAFYNAIGHDAAVFQDATVKKHITAGIMWAVRREALIR